MTSSMSAMQTVGVVAVLLLLIVDPYPALMSATVDFLGATNQITITCYDTTGATLDPGSNNLWVSFIVMGVQ